MKRRGQRSGHLPLAQTSSVPIRMNLPKWLSRKVRAAAHDFGLTEFAYLVSVIQEAVERPGAIPDDARTQ